MEGGEKKKRRAGHEKVPSSPTPPYTTIWTTLHVLTSKVRPVAQLGFLVAAGQHTDSSVLDEVHPPSNCALADDEV